MQCSEVQAVEIRVTQHWLQAILLQLCSLQGFVSSLTGDSISALIARDFVVALEGFSQTAAESLGDSVVSVADFSPTRCAFVRSYTPGNLRYGSISYLLTTYLLLFGLLSTSRLTPPQVKQVFDVVCCLLDAVTHQSSPLHVDPSDLREYIFRLLPFLQNLRGEERQRLLLLHEKLQRASPAAALPWSLGSSHPAPLGGYDASGGDRSCFSANILHSINQDHSRPPLLT